MRIASFASCLLLAMGTTSAWAQSTSDIRQVGPDLAFTCISSDGAQQACRPAAGMYGRYVRLANWRFEAGIDAQQDCRYQATYGYNRNGPWVAGDCHAVFVAPNLRYGDEYNAERLKHSRLGATPR
jgi:hypothetical protein